MKKFKKWAALIAVAVLLIAACFPMYVALTGEPGEAGSGSLMAAMAVAIFVPVMAFAILLVYRVMDKKDVEQDEERLVDNIIFDMGKVLVGYEWEEYLKSFGFSKEKYDKIANATFLNPVWEERDRGLYEEEYYLKKFVEAAPEYEKDIREVMRRSNETLSVLPYADTWVKYLKKQGYKVYLLSNLCQQMVDGYRDQMTFLKYMDGAVFSSEIKELKPEKRIYKKFLDMYGLDPNRCVFLDDREVNCAGARKVGIHVIQFQNLTQASEELKKFGVK